MKLTAKRLEQHGFKKINAFDDSKKEMNPSNELRSIRKAAPQLRDEFLAGGQVKCVHQLLCSIAPYPTQYGFHNAYNGLNPYLYFRNRATLVQFEAHGQLKNLLFNPYFPELSEHSGFYSHLRDTLGKIIPQSLILQKGDR